MHRGRVVFGAMDEVVFGRPASDVIVEQIDRLGAARAFLMVSGTLNRETDVIETIRRALGPRCVATFDAMPAHTPRSAVIAAANQARAAKADLIVTVGGGSITDGAKAVQLCLANEVSDDEGIDRLRAGAGCAPPAMKAPVVRQISAPTGPDPVDVVGIANIVGKAELHRLGAVGDRAAPDRDDEIGIRGAGLFAGGDDGGARRVRRHRIEGADTA